MEIAGPFLFATGLQPTPMVWSIDESTASLAALHLEQRRAAFREELRQLDRALEAESNSFLFGSGAEVVFRTDIVGRLRQAFFQLADGAREDLMSLVDSSNHTLPPEAATWIQGLVDTELDQSVERASEVFSSSGGHRQGAMSALTANGPQQVTEAKRMVALALQRAVRQRGVAVSVSPAAAHARAEPAPDFSSLTSDPEMSAILARRWDECVKCVGAKAHLAAIVMMGGLLEALFVFRAKQLPDKALLFAARATPQRDGRPLPLHEWTLARYLQVGYELGWITPSARDVANVLGEYRNYVHPDKEHRHGVELGHEDSALWWGITKSLVAQLITATDRPRVHRNDQPSRAPAVSSTKRPTRSGASVSTGANSEPLDLKLKWREEKDGLDIAVWNLKSKKVTGFKFSIINMQWRSSKDVFGDVPEFHGGRDAFEEVVLLDGSSELFNDIPVRYTFVRKEGDRLRFQGATQNQSLQQIAITREGIWEVSFLCQDGTGRSVTKVLRFEWTKGGTPRGWKPPAPIFTERAGGKV